VLRKLARHAAGVYWVRQKTKRQDLPMLAGLLALTAAALFTGAAFYINFAEQPARMLLDTRALLTQWKPSYKAGFTMQSTLAIVGCVLGLIAAWQTRSLAFVAGALLIVANWPWTVFGIFPVNHKLLAMDPATAGEEARRLLEQWNKLHAVRTGLGALATVAFLAALSG
jgi:Domain of unknown function (DUF1772)